MITSSDPFSCSIDDDEYDDIVSFTTTAPGMHTVPRTYNLAQSKLLAAAFFLSFFLSFLSFLSFLRAPRQSSSRSSARMDATLTSYQGRRLSIHHIWSSVHSFTHHHIWWSSVHSFTHHHIWWSSVHSFNTPHLVVICPFIQHTTFAGHLSIHSHTTFAGHPSIHSHTTFGGHLSIHTATSFKASFKAAFARLYF